MVGAISVALFTANQFYPEVWLYIPALAVNLFYLARVIRSFIGRRKPYFPRALAYLFAFLLFGIMLTGSSGAFYVAAAWALFMLGEWLGRTFASMPGAR